MKEKRKLQQKLLIGIVLFLGIIIMSSCSSFKYDIPKNYTEIDEEAVYEFNKEIEDIKRTAKMLYYSNKKREKQYIKERLISYFNTQLTERSAERFRNEQINSKKENSAQVKYSLDYKYLHCIYFKKNYGSDKYIKKFKEWIKKL